MSEVVKNLFTDISQTYDKLNHLLSFNIDKSWRRKTISQIHKKSSEQFFALDVCAGTHDLGLECLKQFPNAIIQAMDFSPGMLEAGQKKIAQEMEQGKITPVLADALNMPFDDNTFDIVFCGYGVRNFDDTEKGMKEILRVLKPGGQALILDFFKPISTISKIFNKTYGQFILPACGAMISGHPSAYSYLRDSIRGFLTTNEFESLLEKIGFRKIQTTNYFMNISSCVVGVKT